MQNNLSIFEKKYYFIFFTINLFLLASFITISSAIGSENDNKKEIINRELDFVTSKKSTKILWKNLCYSKNFITNAKESKEEKVNRLLDDIEKKISAEKNIPLLSKLKYPKKEKSIFVYPQKKIKKKNAFFENIQFNAGIYIGQRIDDLNFNIAGNIDGDNPNVLSELIWKDMKMKQIKATGNIIFEDKFVLDGMLASADIYEGDNQDSDYLGDNRSLEFSRSNNQSDDGEAYDASIGLGYRFALPSKNEYFNLDQLWATVLGGYSHHEQHLIMTDGNQTLDPYGMIGFTGTFEGLHNNYETEWKGQWLGVELSGEKNKLSGIFRFEYHQADYYAAANWNLRSTFAHPKSFEHFSEGHGLVFNLGLDYKISNNLSVDFKADIQDWIAEPGIDRTYLADGTSDDTRLNRVDWRSYAFMFGSTYHFN